MADTRYPVPRDTTDLFSHPDDGLLENQRQEEIADRSGPGGGGGGGLTPSWGTGTEYSAIREGTSHDLLIHSNSDQSVFWWPIGDYLSGGVPIDGGNSGDGWTFDVYDCAPANSGHNVLIPPAGSAGAYMAGLRTGDIHPVMTDGSAVLEGEWQFDLALSIIGRTDSGYYEETEAGQSHYLPSTAAFSRGFAGCASTLAPNVGFQRGANNNYDEWAFAGKLKLRSWPEGMDLSLLGFHAVYGWSGVNVWAALIGSPDPRTVG